MNDTRLKFSIIGCGNAGSQIASKLRRDNVPTMIINSSTKDLDQVILKEKLCMFQIGDGRGSGLNRQVAQIFLKDDLDELFETEAFKQLCEYPDVIFIIGSCGGGTGSGISPLLVNRIKKKYGNKTVIPIGVAPQSNNVNVKMHLNFFDWIAEIDAQQCPYMLFDLNRYSNLTIDEAYEKLDNDIITAIDCIMGKYTYPSNQQMIDERDLMVVLNSPGLLLTYKVDLNTEEVKAGLADKFIKTVKANSAIAHDSDHSLQFAAFIQNVPWGVYDETYSGVYEALTKPFGAPIATYTNFSNDNSSDTFIIAILSGLGLPNIRLNESRKIIDEYAMMKSKIPTQKKDLIKTRGELREKASFDNITNQNAILNSSKTAIRETDEKISDDIPDIFG